MDAADPWCWLVMLTEKAVNGIVLYSYNYFVTFLMDHKYKRTYTSLL